MNGNPDGLASLSKYSKLPIERIAYHSAADATIIQSIDRGILYLMAFWSVSAVEAFGKLTEVVSRLDPAGELVLVVVDVDGSPALYNVPEFVRKIHGAGETAWIRSGQIVATSRPKPTTACFESNTALLLSRR